MSEYSEFACFDRYLLWFCPKLATTCKPTNDFSDTLLGLSVDRDYFPPWSLICFSGVSIKFARLRLF